MGFALRIPIRIRYWNKNGYKIAFRQGLMEPDWHTLCTIFLYILDVNETKDRKVKQAFVLTTLFTAMALLVPAAWAQKDDQDSSQKKPKPVALEITGQALVRVYKKDDKEIKKPYVAVTAAHSHDGKVFRDLRYKQLPLQDVDMKKVEALNRERVIIQGIYNPEDQTVAVKTMIKKVDPPKPIHKHKKHKRISVPQHFHTR